MTTTAKRKSFPATILLGTLSLVAATAAATQGVSPGALDHLALVEQHCPTFSWQLVTEAARYEIAAYVLPENSAEPVDLGPDNEVLYVRVPGGATTSHPPAVTRSSPRRARSTPPARRRGQSSRRSRPIGA